MFVGLLVWVMKQNNTREERYQDTIDKLTNALGDVETIKSTVEKIHEKLQ
ncbi:BhlA/UviB family holin-like peptide [Enterococcus faecium]|nr:BhlA/UviB family holin-like peptide [Enterococcus faecium]MDQ8362944.1 BhlA/UviB family holin-like peptide [Enterococcus faecium]